VAGAGLAAVDPIVSVLVIDVGTSSVRAAVVRPDATLAVEHHRATLPDSPMAGLVEFDATVLAEAALDCARRALAAAGPVDAVGIANQRASTIVWDAVTGEPVGPGLGWQDLRTVGDCLVLQGQGLRLAPNLSATKLAHLLDQADPDRTRDLRFGTVDTWLVWHLTEGTMHVTDLSNAGVTGLLTGDGSGWSPKVLEALRIPESVLPEVVDSSGVVAPATALDGAPPIAGIAGDQQASLAGQGCTRRTQAKITFGTGGMLDVVMGPQRPTFERRGSGGTFPIVAWRVGGEITWGLEAIMLSAGTNVEWLRDDLGLIDAVADSHEVAASCETSEGVVYVPALLGLGTPEWDYGARGALLGLTRGTDARHVVRAVLEGVAQRAADLVEAAETDAGFEIGTLRVDGGMTANPTFVQAVADATQRPVEVSPVREATALGAAFLAGMAVGTWAGWDDVSAAWEPGERYQPRGSFDRDRWREACRRAGHWHEDLSALDF
jgi:glycerol kinase